MLWKKPCSKYWVFIFFFLFTSCNWYYGGQAYRSQYAYLQKIPSFNENNFENSPYYIVFLVDARHLDYTNSKTLFKTLTKQPNQENVENGVGHSWVYLCGIKDGREFVLEGGHSGDLGIVQPKYFDGVMNYVDYGYCDLQNLKNGKRRTEPNPIKYLWATQKDGFFQEGRGSHIPTFAVKVNIGVNDFERILDFINPKNYDYSRYSLVDHQCVSFVSQIAFLLGLELDNKITVEVEREMRVYGRKIRLWTNQDYSTITFPSADVLEENLVNMASRGEAEYALEWYLNKIKSNNKKSFISKIKYLPKRLKKSILFLFF